MSPVRASFSKFAYEYDTYRLTGTYYSLRDGLTASLMFNNKGPEPILATPIFYSLAGTKLQLTPIVIPAASYLDVDLHQLLANASDEFSEGSLKVDYQGGDKQLGVQIRLQNTVTRQIWAEQLSYASNLTSSRLESVWHLPFEGSSVKLIVSNTSYAPVTVTLASDGTLPAQSGAVHLTLQRSETRVLDIAADLVGDSNASLSEKGGVSITHSGSPGGMVARMLVSNAARGYSASIPFADPENTNSQRWHGNGLRLRNLDGTRLNPVLVARNTGSTESALKGRIPYTLPNGEVAEVAIPPTTLPAHSTRIINLQGRIASAGLPSTIEYAGIELDYTTQKGSVVVAIQSSSSSGEHVFQVPMFDPEKMPSSAGGFPWRADGDYSTLVYIKNETGTPKKFISSLVFEGGAYSVGVREVKGGQTVAIDFRQIRDSQTADAMGNVIPLGVDSGQIAWSVYGSDNKTLSGRSEQISVQEGVASTYSCANCCPNRYYASWITPYSVFTDVGEVTHFLPIQQDTNCSGQPLPPYSADVSYWDSTNWNVASVWNGSATAVGFGSANIQATWEAANWWYESQRCDYIPVPVSENAPMEVIPTVAITKIDGSALPNPFRLGVNGGGNNRTQTLKATVTPADQATNVSIQVSSKINGSITNVNSQTGVITFNVVGNAESSSGSSCSTGDSFIRAIHSGATLVNKPVFVSVPSAVGTPHDTTGTLVIANRVLDANTSPAWQGLAANDVMLATIFVRYLTISVKDQCNNLIGDLYAGATVTETVGTSTVNINQPLTAASTYLDPVGGANESGVVVRGSPAAIAWPSQPLRPMLPMDETQNIPVQVDGFSLNPAILGRKVIATPSTNSITIIWPN